MSGLLSEEVMDAVGRQSAPQREVVTRRDIRKYAIATDNRQRKYLDGDEAPPMFHVALFWDVVELDQLTPDGVSIDKLLPKFPLDRAMAGGLEINYQRKIYPGDTLNGTITVEAMKDRTIGMIGLRSTYERDGETVAIGRMTIYVPPRGEAK